MRGRRAALLAGCLSGFVVAGIGPGISVAQAHPLNNFSINTYHGLELQPEVVLDHAVIDIAEIPTLQQKGAVDVNGDGTASAAELARRAGEECTTLARSLRGSVNGQPLTWSLGSRSMTYLPGEKGLQVTRIECEFAAPADLRVVADLEFASTYEDDRVGWREITARPGCRPGRVTGPLPGWRPGSTGPARSPGFSPR
jgi:nickel/cobalt transporter (NicO) family protein